MIEHQIEQIGKATKIIRHSNERKGNFNQGKKTLHA